VDRFHFISLPIGNTITISNLTSGQLSNAFPDLNDVSWSVSAAQQRTESALHVEHPLGHAPARRSEHADGAVEPAEFVHAETWSEIKPSRSRGRLWQPAADRSEQHVHRHRHPERE
jgi:hypothetical protein